MVAVHREGALRTAVAAAFGVLLLVACSETTAPAVLLQLGGTVREEGTALVGVRVFLRDQRTELEAGEIVGTGTTDATGRYEFQARAQRPGYLPSCEFLSLYVDGYRYTTVLSTPLRCVVGPQTIDLTVSSEANRADRAGGVTYRRR